MHETVLIFHKGGNSPVMWLPGISFMCLKEVPREWKLQRTGKFLKTAKMLMAFLSSSVSWHSY